MERALYLWLTNARAQNDILREKATRFGNEIGITEFRYSNGWLTRFKSRHNISCLSTTGESAGVDKKLITDDKKKALEVMKNFDSKYISNVDETGLFYRMDHDKSLTTSTNTKGKKKK